MKTIDDELQLIRLELNFDFTNKKIQQNNLECLSNKNSYLLTNPEKNYSNIKSQRNNIFNFIKLRQSIDKIEKLDKKMSTLINIRQIQKDGHYITKNSYINTMKHIQKQKQIKEATDYFISTHDIKQKSNQQFNHTRRFRRLLIQKPNQKKILKIKARNTKSMVFDSMMNQKTNNFSLLPSNQTIRRYQKQLINQVSNQKIIALLSDRPFQKKPTLKVKNHHNHNKFAQKKHNTSKSSKSSIQVNKQKQIQKKQVSKTNNLKSEKTYEFDQNLKKKHSLFMKNLNQIQNKLDKKRLVTLQKQRSGYEKILKLKYQGTHNIKKQQFIKNSLSNIDISIEINKITQRNHQQEMNKQLQSLRKNGLKQRIKTQNDVKNNKEYHKLKRIHKTQVYDKNLSGWEIKNQQIDDNWNQF